jgi:hypothetical protein
MTYYSLDDNDIFIKNIKDTRQNKIMLIHTPHERYNYRKIFDFINQDDISTICILNKRKGFDYVKSLIISNLYHLLNNSSLNLKPSFELCIPYNSITEKPDIIPVSLDENKTLWKENDFICILPGWDFYQVEWILTRWESSLASFDYNSFLPKPNYPKDLYNNSVNPSIIFNTIKMYVDKYTLEELELNFYALYCFYNSKLGNMLLHFFYEESEKTSSNIEIYQKLKLIYHSIPEEDPYRIFLFYKNYSLLTENKKKVFSVYIFINQYLSFNGMFACNKFINDYVNEIFSSLRYINPSVNSLLSKYSKHSVKKELLYLFNSISSCGWISKNKIKNENNYFWKYIYINWNNIDRNIFLWHTKSVQYDDTQMKIGSSILKLFTETQICNFEYFSN